MKITLKNGQEISVEFVQSNRRATPAMIRQMMRSRRLQACTKEELDIFVEIFPEEVKGEKIVALGTWDTMEDGTQGFPCIGPYGGKIDWLYDRNGDDPQYDGWNQSYRYLAKPIKE